MDPIQDSPAPREAAAPLVLVPVMAEDFARRKRRIVLATWAVVVAVILVAGYIYKRSVDPLHAQQSYEAGMRLFVIARYPQAILAFDRAASLSPKFADAFLMRGKANAADGKIERAIADYTTTLELRPNDVQALLARGRAWLELKDYRAVIADANQVLGLEPRSGAAYNLRGLGVRGLGDPRAALQDLTRAIEFMPITDNYFQRGATYQMLGDHARAIADFDEMIAIQPDAAAAYFARAESRRAIGDTRGAQSDYYQGRYLDGR